MSQRETTAIARRRIIAGAAALPVLARALSRPARAAQKVRVAKANAHVISYTALDIGIAKGLFTGLDIDSIEFNGGAKAMQGLVAGDVDLYLGSGPDIAYAVKGVPITCVACVMGPPTVLCIIVPADSPIKTVDDLRHKRVQVSTAGSLTEWLVKDLAATKGWGPTGITTVAIGGTISAQLAGLKTHEVDAIVGTSSLAFQLEDEGRGRLLVPTSAYVKDILFNAVFAENAFAASQPDIVRQFLKGWFRTIAFMRTHKAETVRLMTPITGVSAAAESREYDLVMPSLSSDGKISPQALAVLARSFVDLKILPAEPDMRRFVNETFLPS